MKGSRNSISERLILRIPQHRCRHRPVTYHRGQGRGGRPRERLRNQPLKRPGASFSHITYHVSRMPERGDPSALPLRNVILLFVLLHYGKTGTICFLHACSLQAAAVQTAMPVKSNFQPSREMGVCPVDSTFLPLDSECWSELLLDLNLNI